MSPARAPPSVPTGEIPAAEWLNRNPGNITDGGHGADFGQLAGKLNWHRFMIFATREAGHDAIAQPQAIRTLLA